MLIMQHPTLRLQLHLRQCSAAEKGDGSAQLTSSSTSGCFRLVSIIAVRHLRNSAQTRFCPLITLTNDQAMSLHRVKRAVACDLGYDLSLLVYSISTFVSEFSATNAATAQVLRRSASGLCGSCSES